jgi:hypothetical protein
MLCNTYRVIKIYGVFFLESEGKIVMSGKVKRPVLFKIVCAEHRGNWNVYRRAVSQQHFPDYEI